MEQMKQYKKKNNLSIVLGAALLMATSAVGPSFLTQSVLFTEQYGATFGFAILISLLMSVVVQLTIFRVICMSGLKAHEIGNMVYPGLGHIITFLIAGGCLVFNIGNVAGAGLGLNVIFGIDVQIASIISILLGISIFMYKESTKVIDKLAQFMGAGMILLVFYVAIKTKPPMGEILAGAFMPESIPFFPILTLVGGTVGGYHAFAGGHRLLEGNIIGGENLKDIDQSASIGLIVTAIIRVCVFLAAFGVISRGALLDIDNPAATVFQQGAGNIGYMFFGIVIFSASLTSIVGATYTSMSFLSTTFNRIEERRNIASIIFILISGLTFLIVGRPVPLMVLTGALNGLVLPITLGAMLIATQKKNIIGDYQHPKWLLITGVFVTIVMAFLGITSLGNIGDLF